MPANAIPEPGGIGLIVDANFGLAPILDISEVALFLPDGGSVPLVIDEGSIFEDFVAGGITDLRFFCSVPESALASGGEPFELRWGDGIESPNRVVERLVFDPIERDRYSRLVPTAADSDGGSNIATIMVIAESGADWYFLWYLLPLGVLLALVTVWKVRAGRGNPQQSP